MAKRQGRIAEGPVRRVSFFLPVDVDDHLQTVYYREGVPKAESIRRAIAAYLREKGFKVAEPGPKKGGRTKKRT